MRSTEFLACLAAFASSAVAQLPPTVDSNAQVTKLATLPRESWTIDQPFTEGATRDPATGDVYFVDQNSNKILKWSVANKRLTTFMHPAGYSNGMTFDRNGKLIACADERNQLWEISTNTTKSVPWPTPANPSVGARGSGNIVLPEWTVIMDGKYNGKQLGGPNDVWAMPDNSLYFTDPYWSRRWWPNGRRAEQEVNTVYRLSPDRKTLTRALATFQTSDGRAGSPNGIIGSPDGKTLYVAAFQGPGSGGGETYAYDVGANGALSNRRLWASFGSDGMTMDNAGNMYMTAPVSRSGITVVSIATGRQVGFIPVPESPANLAFGGPDQSVLYITARTGFYSIQTKVKGAHLVK
ncbi:SMP-30/gluconolactonase/LRE family protein [Podospora aff. communis PSN243]|uniref:SMP-30/gluconolactonase/LRE family protein n=1 Tax=Podospora aff. communis PSN243 TaxID=3040156 RepID=A0AAV9GH77_9PEZI|nr:SMP-30/gluconolactonase/LRE family protein [Podospora aff. communis PSN243]